MKFSEILAPQRKLAWTMLIGLVKIYSKITLKDVAQTFKFELEIQTIKIIKQTQLHHVLAV